MTLTRLDKENMRISSKKHLDILSNSKLYPTNPLKNSTPSFSNPFSLLRFTADGYGGLLGYCNVLSSHAETFKHLYQSLSTQYSILLQKHSKSLEEVQELQKKLKFSRRRRTRLGLRDRERHVSSIETLKVRIGGLNRHIYAVS